VIKMKAEESLLTNPTKLYTLLLLYESNRHGYEIIEEFMRRLEKKLSPGQIYPLLKSMMKKGFVEVYDEYNGKRKKKVYRITKEGQEICKDSVEKLKGLFDALK